MKVNCQLSCNTCSLGKPALLGCYRHPASAKGAHKPHMQFDGRPPVVPALHCKVSVAVESCCEYNAPCILSLFIGCWQLNGFHDRPMLSHGRV